MPSRYVIWCMSLRHFYHIWRICHIWRITYDSHIYDNIGVKRIVRTSGMQPLSLNYLATCFRPKKTKIAPTCFSNSIQRRETLKNTMEKSGIRIFQCLALKTILLDIYDGWLHSWGPNASFDTHINIHNVVYDSAPLMSYMSNKLFMTYMSYGI